MICFDRDELDKWWRSSALVRRRERVEKKLRAEIDALALRYGLDVRAGYDERYGTIYPHISITTTSKRAPAIALKARKEEDEEYSRMNTELMKEYRQAEAKMRREGHI